MALCGRAGVPEERQGEAIIETAASVAVEVSGLKVSWRKVGTVWQGGVPQESPGEALGEGYGPVAETLELWRCL